MKWVDDQVQLDMGVKFVLAKLASYADGEGVSWSPIAILAKHINRTERTVQNYLAQLKADGLIADTGEVHRLKDSTRSVPKYQLAPELLAADSEALAASKADASMGEKFSPIDGVWVKKSRGMGETDFTRIDLKDLTLSDESGAGARAQAVSQHFEVVAVLWIAAAPARFAREPAWTAWMAACEHHDPADLVRAARRYLVEGVKVDGGRVKALARWLSDGWFEGFLGEAPSGSDAASDGGGVFADAVIRKTVVTLKGEDFARSYLDRSSWDDAGRTITAWSTYAAAKLRTLGNHPVWPKLAITVRDPEPVHAEGGR